MQVYLEYSNRNETGTICNQTGPSKAKSVDQKSQKPLNSLWMGPEKVL